MRIYHDIKRIGFHDTIHILQRALTFAYKVRHKNMYEIIDV